MTFDGPRKTLDDYRREIDAEFSGPPLTETSTDSAVTKRVVLPRRSEEDGAAIELLRKHGTRQRRRRAGGYIIAVAAGFITGLFGYPVVTHYSILSTARVAPVTRVTSAPSPLPAPSSAATPSSAPPASPAPPSPALTSPAAAISSPTEPASPPPAIVSSPSSRATAAPGTSEASRVPSSSSMLETPASPSGPAASRPVANARKTPPQRIVPATASADWVQLQEQVRQALSIRLASSGLADDSIISDTVVILSPDGRTARTHVPVRRGSGVVILDQCWARQSNQWSLVDDREARQGR